MSVGNIGISISLHSAPPSRVVVDTLFTPKQVTQFPIQLTQAQIPDEKKAAEYGFMSRSFSLNCVHFSANNHFFATGSIVFPLKRNQLVARFFPLVLHTIHARRFES